MNQEDLNIDYAISFSNTLKRLRNFESALTSSRPTYNLNCLFSDFVSDFTNKNKLSFCPFVITQKPL